AQLDRSRVQDRGPAEGGGDPVDHGTLGGAIVDDDAFYLPGCPRQCIVDALVERSHPERAVLRRGELEDVIRGPVRQDLDRLGDVIRYWTLAPGHEHIVPV